MIVELFGGQTLLTQAWTLASAFLESEATLVDVADVPALHHRRLDTDDAGRNALLLNLGIRGAIYGLVLLGFLMHFIILFIVCAIGWCQPVSHAPNSDISWCCGKNKGYV